MDTQEYGLSSEKKKIVIINSTSEQTGRWKLKNNLFIRI